MQSVLYSTHREHTIIYHGLNAQLCGCVHLAKYCSQFAKFKSKLIQRKSLVISIQRLEPILFRSNETLYLLLSFCLFVTPLKRYNIRGLRINYKITWESRSATKHILCYFSIYWKTKQSSFSFFFPTSFNFPFELLENRWKWSKMDYMWIRYTIFHLHKIS